MKLTDCSLLSSLLVIGIGGKLRFNSIEPAHGRPLQQNTGGISKKGNIEMVLVPAGWFEMGDSDMPDNRRHRVFLDSYSIGRTPVTVAQFKAYCAATGLDFSKFPKPDGGWVDDHPMVDVTWQEARDFCKWAGGDLPTDAQWEKAARGATGWKYPWGNEWDESRLKWVQENDGVRQATTEPVDAHPSGASPYGCLDMEGNVWQWCLDWSADIKPIQGVRNPTGPASGTTRVIRGGFYLRNSPESFRTSLRYGDEPSKVNGIQGLRLVCPP